MRLLVLAAVVLASWVGSLGIAFGITEWRGVEVAPAIQRIVPEATQPSVLLEPTPNECERIWEQIAKAETELAVRVLHNQLPSYC